MDLSCILNPSAVAGSFERSTPSGSPTPSLTYSSGSQRSSNAGDAMSMSMFDDHSHMVEVNPRAWPQDQQQIPPLACVFPDDPFASFRQTRAGSHSPSMRAQVPGHVRYSSTEREVYRVAAQFTSMRVSTGASSSSMRASTGSSMRVSTAIRKPVRQQPDKPHSNKAYTIEQVDKTRYYKDDKNLSWVGVKDKFADEVDARGSNQCYSSRYYRDNKFPVFDEHDCPILDVNGKQEWLIVKVRDRSTQSGRIAELPFCLVDKHPDRAVKYNWISEDCRKKAQKNLDDPEHDIRIRRTVTAVWREQAAKADRRGRQSVSTMSSTASTPTSSTSSSRQVSPAIQQWQIESPEASN